MLELYLLRHAKATREGGELSDAERPLSRRGRRQAAAMAPALMRWGALEGEVVSSPARRTRETLEAMAEALPENSLKQRLRLDEALYTFDGEALRAWLQALPEGSRRVLVRSEERREGKSVGVGGRRSVERERGESGG